MDFQRDIALRGGRLAPADDEGLARFEATIMRAKATLSAARKVSLPVIHVRIARRPDDDPALNPHAPLARFISASGAVVEGEPGAEIIEALAPRPDEVVVTKRMVSAFVGTDLEQLLRGLDIRTVVLMGLVTHFVVEGTARHAADLGYRVVTLSDACSSAVLSSHEHALQILARIGEVSTTADFVSALKG